jgi:hypothetical protein
MSRKMEGVEIMDAKTSEVKQIATQILAGMLANPHIYASISDERARGRQEQDLVVMAIEMAERLIEKVEKNTSPESQPSDER